MFDRRGEKSRPSPMGPPRLQKFRRDLWEFARGGFRWVVMVRYRIAESDFT